MFENLTKKFTNIFEKLKNKKYINNIDNILHDVKLSLIDADVSYSTVDIFIKNIKNKFLEQKTYKNIKSKKSIMEIIYGELVILLGDKKIDLNYKSNSLISFLLVGIQGSGKTTTAAKLAKYVKESTNKNVLLSSLDIYRPAAIDQLKSLSNKINVNFFISNQLQPDQIAKQTLHFAKSNNVDMVIFDTAGRLHTNHNMMNELKILENIISPTEILLVIDSMTGQDAINIANIFNTYLSITGIILTKIDSDTKGGAALSIRHTIDKPIKFFGNGENINDIEPFYPNRIASRILGMGDILGIIDSIEYKNIVSSYHDEKNKHFDLEELKKQLVHLLKIKGGIYNLINKIPGIHYLSNKLNTFNEKSIKKTIAIINSMTMQEKQIPRIIIGSRKKRIAIGSGTHLQDVNRLLKQYNNMQKMMNKLKNIEDRSKIQYLIKNIFYN